MSRPSLGRVQLLIALICVALDSVGASCVIGSWCKLDDGTMTEYILTDSYVTNDVALLQCLGYSGNLISFADPVVSTRLLALLPSSAWNGAWSGLQYAEASGYKFTTGERLTNKTTIVETRSPCYAVTTHELGLVLNATGCGESRRVACQRVNASSGWFAGAGASDPLWNFFTAPFSHEQASKVCEGQEPLPASLGYVSSMSMASYLVGQAARYFSEDSMELYDIAGFWVNLEQQGSTFVWTDVHGGAQWVPPVDTAVTSSCVMVTMFESTVRFKTADCSETRPFLCTRSRRKTKRVSIATEAITSWKWSALWQESSSDFYTVSTANVTVDPAPRSTVCFVILSSHPQIVRAGFSQVCVTPPAVNATFPIIRLKKFVRELYLWAHTVQASDEEEYFSALHWLRNRSIMTLSMTITDTDNQHDPVTRSHMKGSPGTLPANDLAAPTTTADTMLTNTYVVQSRDNVSVVSENLKLKCVAFCTFSLTCQPSTCGFSNPLPVGAVTNTQFWGYVSGTFLLKIALASPCPPVSILRSASIPITVVRRSLPMIDARAQSSKVAEPNVWEAIRVGLAAVPQGGVVELQVQAEPEKVVQFKSTVVSVTNVMPQTTQVEWTCVEGGTAQIVISCTSTARNIDCFDDPVRVNVNCDAQSGTFLVAGFTPYQLVDVGNKQDIYVYCTTLPPMGTDVQLRVLYDPAVVAVSPSVLQWTPSSMLTNTFSVIGLTPGQTNITFATEGSYKAYYVPPAALALAIGPKFTYELNYLPSAAYEGREFGFVLALSQLPSPRLAVEVSFSASLIEFTPKKVVFVGGSHNDSFVSINAVVPLGKVLTDRDVINITTAGTAAAQFEPAVAQPYEVEVKPLKTVSVSVALLQVGVGESLSKSFNVTISSLPDEGTLTVFLRSFAAPYFFTVTPTVLIFTPELQLTTQEVTVVGHTPLAAGVNIILHSTSTAPVFTGLDDELAVSVTVARPSVIEIVSFPNVVFSELQSGESFFITIDSRPGLEQNATITISIPAPYNDGIEVVPNKYVFDARSSTSPEFIVYAWRTMQKVPIHFNAIASPGISTSLVPSNDFLVDVVDTSHVVPVLRPVLYVGQTVTMSIRVVSNPASSGSLVEASLAVTPLYNGTDRSLDMNPQFVRFLSSPGSPTSRSIFVKSVSPSPAGFVVLRLSGPASKDYTPFGDVHVIVKQIRITFVSPTSVYLGDALEVTANISDLPTCGVVRLTVQCDGCDGVLFLPTILEWSPTSQLEQKSRLYGKSLAANLPLTATAVQSCGDGTPLVDLSSDRLSVAERDMLSLVNEVDPTLEQVVGVVGVDILVRVVILRRSVMVAALPVVRVELLTPEGSILAAITNYTEGAVFRFQVKRAVTGFPLQARVVDTSRFEPSTLVLHISARSQIVVSLSTVVVASSQFPVTATVGALPPQGALTLSLVVDPLVATSESLSAVFLPTGSPTSHTFTLTAQSNFTNASIGILLSGSAAHFYVAPDSIYFDVLKQLDVGVACNGVPLASGTYEKVLAAGGTATVSLWLPERPAAHNTVVFAVVELKGSNAVYLSDSQFTWDVDRGGFDAVRSFSVTPREYPVNISVHFRLFSLYDEFFSMSSIQILFVTTVKHFISIDGHQPQVFQSGTFNVSICPSHSPQLEDLIVTVVPGDAAAAALLYTATPTSLVWQVGDAAEAKTVSFQATSEVGSVPLVYSVSGTAEYSHDLSWSTEFTVVSNYSVIFMNWPSSLVEGVDNGVNVTVVLRDAPYTRPHFPLLRIRTSVSFLRMIPDEISFDKASTLTQQTFLLVGNGASGGSRSVVMVSDIAWAVNISDLSICTYLLGTFRYSASSFSAYPGATLSLSVVADRPITDPIALTPQVVCDEICMQNRIEESDYSISPPTLLFYVGEASKSLQITAKGSGKSFILKFTLQGQNVKKFVDPPSTRIYLLAPNKITVATPLPSQLYVGYKYSLTLKLDATVSQGTVTLIPVFSGDAASTDRSAITWTRLDPRSTTLLVIPKQKGPFNLSWVLSSETGYVAPAASSHIVAGNSWVYVSAVKERMVSNHIQNVVFSLSSSLDAEETLSMEISVNDTTALQPYPEVVGLIGERSKTVQLRAGSFLQRVRYVLVEFNTISSTGRFAPTQRYAVVRVARPKGFTLYTPKNSIAIGESVSVIVELTDEPSDGEVVIVQLSYSGSVGSLSIVPTALYFSKGSTLTSESVVTGSLTTNGAEQLSAVATNTTEFQTSKVSVNMTVERAVLVVATVPSSCTTTTATSANITLSERLFKGEAVIKNLVTVSIQAIPDVVQIDPLEIAFNSNDPLTKTFTIIGRKTMDNVELHFSLGGLMPSSFAAPAPTTVNIIEEKMLQVDLPTILVLHLGIPYTFTITSPVSPKQYEQLIATPELNCPSFGEYFYFSPAVFVFRKNETVSVTIYPVAVTSACTMTLSSSGNSSVAMSYGGIWSVTVDPVPTVQLVGLPTVVYNGTKKHNWCTSRQAAAGGSIFGVDHTCQRSCYWSTSAGRAANTDLLEARRRPGGADKKLHSDSARGVHERDSPPFGLGIHRAQRINPAKASVLPH